MGWASPLRNVGDTCVQRAGTTPACKGRGKHLRAKGGNKKDHAVPVCLYSRSTNIPLAVSIIARLAQTKKKLVMHACTYVGRWSEISPPKAGRPTVREGAVRSTIPRPHNCLPSTLW